MIGHVFKYQLNPALNEMRIPSNFAICDINHQNGELFLWAMVDVHAPLETFKFAIHGTGWKIDDVENLFFLKTVHMPNGLVWHVFKVIEESK